MVKQAVKVVVRARPTANFASKNIKIDPMTGVSIYNTYIHSINLDILLTI